MINSIINITSRQQSQQNVIDLEIDHSYSNRNNLIHI